MIQLVREPYSSNKMVENARPWPRPLHFFSRGRFRNQTNKTSKLVQHKLNNTQTSYAPCIVPAAMKRTREKLTGALAFE